MYFTKYPHRANFSFADGYDEDTGELRAGERTFTARVQSHEGDLYHIRVSNSRVWDGNRCLEPLEVPNSSSRARLKAGDSFDLKLTGKQNRALLKGRFGVCGEQSLFEFTLADQGRFYGMGEKTFGRVELSGLRAKFWNTDVWGDFHFAQWLDHPTDPPYFSLPYLAARIGDEYVGFLLHNPFPAFMETPGTDESRVFVEWQRTAPTLLMGNEGGEPNLWIIYGQTLQELTRKLQKLVGVTPLPPIWSLGYHQSRWGYGGHDDLLDLDKNFEKHQIPCDSLWLDLDYMDGFRIFQTSKEMFPKGAQKTAEALKTNRRRIVPILDPGVKFDPGYPVYDDGHSQGVFCKNAEGKEFIGMVWPGETVFPDFTQQKGRDWWAGYAAEFRKEGFGATWVDMNDPSTGPVDPNGMLFNGGMEPHAMHHNQYSLGMQMATRQGFLKAEPHERPFILSRSGYIGSSKHAAVWTGDNLSNYFYLKLAIPTSVCMSISGLPFNGPDIGGFGGDVSDALMIDWVKACFLFPFFRNHSAKDTRPQEPFSLPEPVMKVMRRYIRLRYKLLPYLYNLFAQQEEHGDPVMRPLFYDFDGERLDKIDDQFMIGSALMQAPFVDEKERTRAVTLPGDELWFDAAADEWLGSGEVSVKKNRESTPLYIRAGSVVPMQKGTPTDNTKELLDVNFHIFMPPMWSGDCGYEYAADDGISFDYQSGARSRLKIRVISVDGNVAISTEQLESGFGDITPTFVLHGEFKTARVNGAAMKNRVERLVLTGKPLKSWVLVK